MDCIAEENLSACTCTYMSCDRRGKCCACIAYHRKQQEIPGCFFSKEAERSYDRSISRFMKEHK
ncbi:MAG: DUF6485 family protein [Syntrophorhabdales bacterium]|jgi:hypothetical protein